MKRAEGLEREGVGGRRGAAGAARSGVPTFGPVLIAA